MPLGQFKIPSRTEIELIHQLLICARVNFSGCKYQPLVREPSAFEVDLAQVRNSGRLMDMVVKLWAP
jgi:hypothetical protein